VEKSYETPVPESYWVRPGQLLAGNYPEAEDKEEVRARLRRMLESGIRVFVDLTEAGEKMLDPYASLLAEEAAALGVAAEHHRLPITDFETPTAAQMSRILDTIDAALAAGQAAYVHCFFGIGRTGTVVGCYLVRHGLTGEQALAELTRLRQGTYFEGMMSPVTEAQRQMVQDWPPGK